MIVANRKKNVRQKRNRRMLILGLGSIAVIIMMTLTIGKYWIDIYDKYKEKQELEEKLAELQKKEKELKLDADKLQDPDYIARYAREKYSYSKDGEFIIKIPEK
ncbi:MAG: septum formation initiator family protein [Bacilli bacterium]|nr:septum formation initiator family protein [Bacilli bacterium]